MEENSLNPYFSGRCSLRLITIVKGNESKGLNPYFSGRCSLRLVRRTSEVQ